MTQFADDSPVQELFNRVKAVEDAFAELANTVTKISAKLSNSIKPVAELHDKLENARYSDPFNEEENEQRFKDCIATLNKITPEQISRINDLFKQRGSCPVIYTEEMAAEDEKLLGGVNADPSPNQNN